MGKVEAKGRRVQVQHAPDEQSCSDQQSESESGLKNDECPAQVTGPGMSSIATAKGSLRISFEGGQRRRKATDETGSQGQERGERQHRTVKADRTEACDVKGFRYGSHERGGTRPGK